MLIIKKVTIKHHAFKECQFVMLVIILSALICCSAKSYAQSTQNVIPSPPLASFLTHRQEQLIRSLPENPCQIPAWLIAELLPCSEQLYDNIISHKHYLNSIKVVTLNQLFADFSAYQTKLIAIRAVFGTVKPVSNKLILTSPDRCWSVIAFDAKYLHPIQCFTSQYPSGFRKGRQIYIIGYLITNRCDCQENSVKILVPVLIGAIMPAYSPAYDSKGNKSFKGFLGLIAILVLLYLIVRIYIAKSSDKKTYVGKSYFSKRK